MFEDDAVCDAFEFLNNQSQNEYFRSTDKLNQGVDEDHKKQPPFLPLQSEQQTPEDARRRQKYEIGIHKGKNKIDGIKGQRSSVDGNNLDVSGITITRPLIEELERKGILMKTTETTNTDMEGSGKKNSCSLDSEQQILLDDALQDFNYPQYLSYGRRKGKSDGEKTKSGFIRQPLDQYETTKKHNIKTLGDSLSYFGLSSQLLKLETSLEDVRKNRKSREDHENYFKQIDKEIQKLSFKYHPDKVKNRGGTENDIKTAQNLQTAVNSTRTALKLLNSAFLEDIGTDHKFGFYTNLGISSVCNEDEMKERIYEVIFKIGVLSRIKQQNIISEIRKFLIESKNCVHSYLSRKFDDFEKARNLALLHLKYCIKGFKKLYAELEEVKEQCKSEENCESMLLLLQNMARESKRDLELLKSLKKIAKSSLKGNYHFFSPVGVVDPYFVLPIISYTNVILMCNVIVRKTSFFDILNFHTDTDPYYRDDLGYLMHPYYLASYCSGNKYNEKYIFKIMGKEHLVKEGEKIQISKEEIESEFHTCILQITDFMEHKFIVEHYYEAPTTNLLALDLKKCLTLMTEFQEKEEEVSKDMRKFQEKTEKMNEKYEKFDKMMAAAEELDQKFKERLEKNKKLNEKFTSVFSEQLRLPKDF